MSQATAFSLVMAAVFTLYSAVPLGFILANIGGSKRFMYTAGIGTAAFFFAAITAMSVFLNAPSMQPAAYAMAGGVLLTLPFAHRSNAKKAKRRVAYAADLSARGLVLFDNNFDADAKITLVAVLTAQADESTPGSQQTWAELRGHMKDIADPSQSRNYQEISSLPNGKLVSRMITDYTITRQDLEAYPDKVAEDNKSWLSKAAPTAALAK